MIDVKTLKEAVQIVTDKQGAPVVQVPLPVWRSLISELEADTPQHVRIRALLDDWIAHPDDIAKEWWDEFDEFIKANRFSIPERDLKLGDE